MSSLAVKLLSSHMVDGSMKKGEMMAIKIDQTLTQDATGTMAYLQMEAMGVDKVKTELSVSYVDHNTLQVGFENADDHRYLQSVAMRHGVVFSRAGNGICHQVHLERFGVPGKTLLGSDSHTPTGGSLGMLAIGAGGLDVALAMAGMAFWLPAPEVVKVHLTGKLSHWVAAKDVILELLRRLSCKGGVGRIFEYSGPGLACLSVPERGTITNMGAELGATTSLFPSDEETLRFLRSQGREADYVPLAADEDAVYDDVIELDLSTLEPMIALPHMPDQVVPVREVAGLPVDQVFIGSCTNSSYLDLMKAASILDGKTVAEGTSLCVAPGSRQVMTAIAENHGLSQLIRSGARILECACGPCVGVGQAPCSGGVSLRTSNRNFLGRSGTADGKVHLVSVETAAASALTGVITDPRTLGEPGKIAVPERFEIDDRMVIWPPEDRSSVEILRGPNIKPLPVFPPMGDILKGEVLLKVGDNITTDHIMPAGAKILPLRSNIPAISKHCYGTVDPSFPERAVAVGGGIIVGGRNYGQGSSREHAALAPQYLGIKAVIALSYARIHRQNLINSGILPLLFQSQEDYGRVKQGEVVMMDNLINQIDEGTISATFDLSGEMTLINDLSKRQRDTIKAGGTLNVARAALMDD